MVNNHKMYKTIKSIVKKQTGKTITNSITAINLFISLLYIACVNIKQLSETFSLNVSQL